MDTTVTTLTIKNVPDELYRLLKETAGKHRRSINSEALLRLELALRYTEVNEEELMQRIRSLRADFPVRLTEKERRAAVADGRA